jgi:ubiquinone/menaquinone biosynthesis C-methylase UbiE
MKPGVVGDMDPLQEKSKHWASHFTEQAGKYLEDPARALDFSNEKLMQQVHRTILKGLDLEKGMKILDAGCGFGGTLIHLAKAFPDAQCVGIDMSDTLLDLARQTAEAGGLEDRVTFEKADVQEIPYPDDSFDVVISTNVLHHVADPLAMLHELERVLAPEGMLYIADIRRSRLATLFDKAFREAMSYGEVLALLYEAKYPREPFTSGFLWWRYER